MILDWDADRRKVTLAGTDFADSPFEKKVTDLVKSWDFDWLSQSMQQQYIQVRTRYDVCPNCGGDYHERQGTGDVSVGYCKECLRNLFLAEGKVRDQLTGKTGRRYVWDWFREVQREKRK